MEQNIEKPKKRTSKQVNKPNGGRGGAKPGAGRPKGVGESVTIKGLLEKLQTQSGGKNYEELLVQDFLQARDRGDTHLTMKYHNLILNKVMVHLAKIEITDSQENIENKQLAFAEALSKFTGLKKD